MRLTSYGCTQPAAPPSLRRPFPPPLNPRNNLHVHRSDSFWSSRRKLPRRPISRPRLPFATRGRADAYRNFGDSTPPAPARWIFRTWKTTGLSGSRTQGQDGDREGSTGQGRKIRIEPPWSRRWETELATIVLRWEAVRSLRVLPLDAAVPCARVARFSQHTPSVGIGARIVSRNLGSANFRCAIAWVSRGRGPCRPW